MQNISPSRPSPIAGSWYPGNPDKLAESIDRYFAGARLPAMKGEVVGLIAPHAGHIYSGQTAAYAFKTVHGKKYDIVVVISPLHQYHFAPILVSGHEFYETPLGQIKIDRQAVNAVDANLQKAGLSITPILYDKEHSLEIELPFLQRSLQAGFQLLPLMLRAQDAQTAQKLGEALAAVLREQNALLVASTDLSHFFSLAEANALDKETLSQIEHFSPEGVLHADETGTGAACGVAAVAAVLGLPKHWAQTRCTSCITPHLPMRPAILLQWLVMVPRQSPASETFLFNPTLEYNIHIIHDDQLCSRLYQCPCCKRLVRLSFARRT